MSYSSSTEQSNDYDKAKIEPRILRVLDMGRRFPWKSGPADFSQSEILEPEVLLHLDQFAQYYAENEGDVRSSLAAQHLDLSPTRYSDVYTLKLDSRLK